MDFKVNTVHFTADKKLVNFIQEKVNKLGMMSDQIISSEVYLRVDKKNSDQENKIAEVKLLMPGSELFAKKQCRSFEEATDNVVDALKRQIEKYKAKVA